MDTQLHSAKASILYSLRHAPHMRYSDLMRPTNLESDTFKFHLRSLCKSGLIAKERDGRYSLTPSGKEFANGFDNLQRTSQKQPKLSLLIVLSRVSQTGKIEYLFQKRLRNPFWGYWGNIGGPILWGEPIEKTAARELKKQTGLSADFTIKAYLRQRDFRQDTAGLLEDKLFTIIEASHARGEFKDKWPGGANRWMTLDKLEHSNKYFASTLDIINLAQGKRIHDSLDIFHAPEAY